MTEDEKHKIKSAVAKVKRTTERATIGVTRDELALIIDALEVLNPASEEGRETRLSLLRTCEDQLARMLAGGR